jgi:hypothetical protein
MCVVGRARTRILACSGVSVAPSLQTVKWRSSSITPLLRRVGMPSLRRWGSIECAKLGSGPAGSSTVCVDTKPARA